MPLRARSALRSTSRRTRPTTASAVSNGFSRLGTAFLLERAGQFSDAAIEGHDLLAQQGDVAAGRQVHQMPEAPAAPFHELAHVIGRAQREREHLRELLGLHDGFELRGDARVDSVERLSPERLRGGIGHASCLPLWLRSHLTAGRRMMERMDMGFGLPVSGAWATPANIRTVATA